MHVSHWRAIFDRFEYANTLSCASLSSTLIRSTITMLDEILFRIDTTQDNNTGLYDQHVKLHYVISRCSRGITFCEDSTMSLVLHTFQFFGDRGTSFRLLSKHFLK